MVDMGLITDPQVWLILGVPLGPHGYTREQKLETATAHQSLMHNVLCKWAEVPVAPDPDSNLPLPQIKIAAAAMEGMWEGGT
uniref:Uncharacterized protein n=1 Tax=Chromera velia CCMP2878 TaxID=1169474 RepID=A0A0G4HNP3_9ALVE|eukprot:Cvel_29482.t1-p1 / transcript=Cvel_29482.t1 / gene=Cvel_29482 / organism=Chromera_velia_CCMP2878 / gene_product=hypothetical protein / transcript_product=hypothetical protein / location=Cvel_scaffold4045:7205-7447(-) / protein_length=81 / sequence_SO=supercontig / SO=protein_coding / is_pseudo=false